ncbi:MAG TPA: hypothetical protein VNH11_10895 [Pirellulales bacterium]|nr:hypothetical protein [Pirellulales bacterium]
MPIEDLTLDVNVLISHNKSNIPCEDKHRNLMKAFESLVFLALDDAGHIKQLYVNRLGSNSLATKWLASLASKSRIHLFPLGRIPKPLKVKFDETGFHWADDKYVRLAMMTPDKHWVTEDTGINASHRKLISDHVGVTTHDTQSACDLLGI